MSTDSEIIARSLDDPVVFGELYLRHAAVVRSYCWRRVGESIADDVTADTFLHAFKGRARFDLGRDNARPWLLGIATRLLHSHLRSEVRRLIAYARAADDPTVADPSIRVAEKIDAVTTARAVTRALERMPARDRDCLLLYAQGDLSYDDVAEAMNIPVGTVRSRLNRARAALRTATNTTPSDTHLEADHGRADAFPHNA